MHRNIAQAKDLIERLELNLTISQCRNAQLWGFECQCSFRRGKKKKNKIIKSLIYFNAEWKLIIIIGAVLLT